MDPLVTPEEFAGYMQRDLDRYTAELVLAGASGLVREFCGGWAIGQVDETFTVDGNGSVVLPLPTLRLNAVTEVRVDGTALIPDTDYVWSANGVLYRFGAWPNGLRNIAADVNHGYDPVPPQVRIVVCAVAAKLYANPEGLSGRSSGDGSRSFIALSDVEMQLISGYRKD